MERWFCQQCGDDFCFNCVPDQRSPAEKYQAIVEALKNGDIRPFKAEVRSGSVGRGERAVGGFVCVRARMFGCVWT